VPEPAWIGMRILSSVLGDATGGRWQVVCDHSRILARRGHEVRLLVGARQRDLSAVPQGVAVERIRNSGHYDLLAAWSAARRLRGFAPHLAMAHCSRSVALLKRALGAAVPVVAVSHSNKVRRLLPADAFVALTPHIREQLMAEGDRRMRGKPCFVVPNMIRLRDRSSPRAATQNALPRLVALGRFDVVKGFDVFVRALADLRRQGLRFTAQLGGAGGEEQALKRLAHRLGLSEVLAFPGWVQDPPAFLAGADLLCVPARADAFGLTPLQGAVAGVPLVLSRASGHLAMFGEEHEALFFAVDDAASLATQIRRIVGDPELAARLRSGAFERVRTCYDEPRVGERLVQAVERIVRAANSV
jgi:glycosyltransferase involved in cell wall biosynthesis